MGGWGQWRTSESRTTTGRRPRASDPATAVSPKVEPAGPAAQCSCVCVCVFARARARACVCVQRPAGAGAGSMLVSDSDRRE